MANIALDETELEEGREEGRPLILHVLRYVPMIVILGLLVHFLLPRIATIEASLQTMKTLAPWAIAMAIGWEILSYLANGLLLQSVLNLAGESLPMRRTFAIEIGAATVSLVAAGALGFGAAIYKWTRARGVSREAAMLASWLPSVFDATALVVFALIGAVNLVFFNRLSRTTLVALSIVMSALLAAIAAIIVLLANRELMNRITSRLARMIKRVNRRFDDATLIEAVERAEQTWQTMRTGGWIQPALCSAMVLTFDLLCLRYSFLAAGQTPKLSLLLAGYGVPILLGRASFLPGGIAVIEVAMAALFGGLGVPTNVAVVAVLTYRMISFWLPTAIGIPIAITLQSRKHGSRT